MNQLIKEVGLNLKPGKYIIAVSGGIDSVVLLDLLSKKTGLKLIVAHFDHGIRSNSKQDRLFVEELSKDYKLPFHYKSVQLGKDASELVAREARYSFLFEICESEQALGVITAHHKDDVIETAIFNLIRGSGRKGISSLDSSGKLRRPLLKITKDEIMAYAKQNDIVWREDQSNKDLKYSRNLIRHKLSSQKKSKNFLNLTQHIENIRKTNIDLDREIDSLLKAISTQNKIIRLEFIKLPHNLALEVMAHYLRQNGYISFNSKLLNHVVVAAKAYANGKKFSVNAKNYILIDKNHITFKTI